MAKNVFEMQPIRPTHNIYSPMGSQGFPRHMCATSCSLHWACTQAASHSKKANLPKQGNTPRKNNARTHTPEIHNAVWEALALRWICAAYDDSQPCCVKPCVPKGMGHPMHEIQLVNSLPTWGYACSADMSCVCVPNVLLGTLWLMLGCWQCAVVLQPHTTHDCNAACRGPGKHNV